MILFILAFLRLLHSEIHVPQFYKCVAVSEVKIIINGKSCYVCDLSDNPKQCREKPYLKEGKGLWTLIPAYSHTLCLRGKVDVTGGCEVGGHLVRGGRSELHCCSLERASQR